MVYPGLVIALVVGAGIAYAYYSYYQHSEDDHETQNSHHYTHFSERSRRSRRNSQQSINCSICLSDVTSMPAIVLPCKHLFHMPCIEKWKDAAESHGRCPNCRTRIEVIRGSM